MSDDKKSKIEKKIVDIRSAITKDNKSNSSRKKSGSRSTKAGSVQNIHGNGNNVAGRDINIFNQPVKKAGDKIMPAPGSIGADPDMRRRIEDLIVKIRDARMARLGETDYAKARGIINKSIQTTFSLKGSGISGLWNKRIEMSGEVIQFLEDSFHNNKEGRIAKAASKAGYQHTRGHLFKKEKIALEIIGWAENSQEAKDMRKLITGHESRSQMSTNEYRDWVYWAENAAARKLGEPLPHPE